MGMSMDGGRVDIRLMSLRDLIVVAYRIRPYHLADTPGWMTTEVFDIMATIPAGVSRARVPEMLQTLLTERFGLRIRRENREMPVYAMTVANGGPRFREVPPDDPEAEPVVLKARPFVSGQSAAAEAVRRYLIAVATLQPNRCTWKYPGRQWLGSQTL